MSSTKINTSQIVVNEQITLEPFQPEDKAALILYLNDPVLYANTLKVPNPYTAIHAEEWLLRVEAEKDAPGGIANWSIRHREAGLIGGIGAFMKTGLDGHLDEIGYWLAEPFRGQGIMTEVVRRYTEWLFDTRPALRRIEAGVFAHNPASARVLEKAGFVREGYARQLHEKNGVFIDAILLAKLRY
ncbi:MAG: GNAT family N-acetyltransferase [Saprospiraceae bacterium]|nr:GNAT family N-acetyltransferase [Saprospiraceae bacterium]